MLWQDFDQKLSNHWILEFKVRHSKISLYKTEQNYFGSPFWHWFLYYNPCNSSKVNISSKERHLLVQFHAKAYTVTQDIAKKTTTKPNWNVLVFGSFSCPKSFMDIVNYSKINTACWCETLWHNCIDVHIVFQLSFN